jgi:hypothetical protein
MYVVPLALFIGCIAPPDDADDKVERGVHKSATQQWKETVAKLPEGVRLPTHKIIKTTVSYPDWGLEDRRFRVRVTTLHGTQVWAGHLSMLSDLGMIRIPRGHAEVNVLFLVPGERHETVRLPIVDGKLHLTSVGGAK